MREIISKLITPQEGEVSPLFLQLVVAVVLLLFLMKNEKTLKTIQPGGKTACSPREKLKYILESRRS